ncbi:XshC-Cox1 family protein [Parafrankia colletiae]|uniref:XshC-Cox1 family protein n=1 Tax=Parafrankia colletiae TaxID=573497 RepID=A0A1S1QYM0_9ACTN|nr:XdhC/CoxI family protein [Parafrankia colletiae]MCK9899167.1 XdhC family protein [Frankia sp. Cpl3]OHV38716.1 XshC-Cox1 family protein [Parafrankia colletiae]
MRDVLMDLHAWWLAGETAGLATVVGAWQSAPRQPGAAMVVGPGGTAVGSVSGGCVEGAVYELAEQCRANSRPVLERFGVSDDEAFAVGLTCGGVIDIFVEPVSRQSFPELGEVLADVEAGRPVALGTLVAGTADASVGAHLIVRPGGTAGTLGSACFDAAVRDDAQGMLEQGSSGMLHYGPHGERRGDDNSVFVASFAPKPRMLVFGAIDFVAALARVGSFLGYRVTVCDARATFATHRRFPDADEVVVDWPHRYLTATAVDPRTVVCVLTHDPKFDVPLLDVALRLPLAYLGVMGSRRTHADRERRLRELGFTDGDLARLHAPIGLDIGGRTPQETAISIAAEIVAVRRGGTGGQLRALVGPIHHGRG